MWSALAQVLGGAQCWEVKVLAEGRDKARSGYEKPYTEAWEAPPPGRQAAAPARTAPCAAVALALSLVSVVLTGNH